MKMVQANRMVLPRSRLSRVPSGSNNGDFLPPDDSFTAGKKGFKFSYDKQKIYTYNISRYDYCIRALERYLTISFVLTIVPL